MGSFLCQISEKDWIKSREIGLYGNKMGKYNDRGDYSLFKENIISSIIRDLVGMSIGDNVLFHVINKSNGPSAIHGIYQITSEPFYDKTKIWDDNQELFPYRFCFKPHPDFQFLSEFDSYIAVTDFYELIEKRKIWTLATLENEMNIESRSVRKIEDNNEIIEIVKTLYRDCFYNKLNDKIEFKGFHCNEDVISLSKCIEHIGRYENSIKALLMYRLSKNDFEYYDNVIDFMNEVFIAQTTRKSIDILIINESEFNTFSYVICEVKTNTCDEKSLKQVLYYMDLFKQKEIFGNNNIEGCLIGKGFSSDIIEYCNQRSELNFKDQIKLIKYIPYNGGTDAKFELISGYH